MLEFTSKLVECDDCMLARDIRAPITKQMSNRSDGKPGRVFADSSGEEEFPAPGGKQYVICFRDGYSRFMKVYLLR